MFIDKLDESLRGIDMFDELYALLKTKPRKEVWVEFTSRVAANDWVSCWIWDTPTRPYGYGRLHVAPKGQLKQNGKSWYVHSLMLRWLCGAPPPGHKATHVCCHTRLCVNPLHLAYMTHRSNVLRIGSNCLAADLIRRAHCKHGHPLSGANLQLIQIKGKIGQIRRCKQCSSVWTRNYRENKKLNMQCR